MNGQKKIALYMRLSKEDENAKEESNSIRTQRLLLRRFAEEHFKDGRILEFQDDGYSGVSMDRPGVAAMLELVKKSALDCIIVKDFSRFSRDYIELGTYLEQIFPFMGVRFISVNDNYDSEACSGAMEEMDVSFRNLMYDLYSKDLSVKVKSSLAAQKRQGQYISANCPFGYEKAPDDKRRLVIEEDEAEIVRRIFRMAMEGKTSTQIAKAFNKEGIKTPIEFKMEKGKTSRKAKGDTFAWKGSTICAILRNETYTGDMVYGKTYKNHVGGRKRILPRSEWKIYRNHHAPIISRELFEEIQRGRGGGKARDKGKLHPLSGRLICGGCGRSLHIRKGLNPYFCCPSLYDNPMEGCIRKANAMFLEQFCLYELQQHLEQASERDSIWMERRQELEQRLEELKAERWRLQAQLRGLIKRKVEVYERYAETRLGRAGRCESPGEESGKHSEEKWKERSREHEGTDAELRDSLGIINSKAEETACRLSETDSLIDSIETELVRKQGGENPEMYLGISELTQEVMQRFIRKIVVKGEEDVVISWCD